MKKVLLLLTISLILGNIVAQEPEIKDIKRFMSLGERNGLKIAIPTQNVKSFEKILTNHIKSIGASVLKAPKGNSELIFNKLYLKGTEEPLMFFNALEQESTKVGYYAYISKIDSTEVLPTESLKELLIILYKKSMISVYDDSIKDQSKIVEKAENGLKDLMKNREKAEKNIAKLKSNISDLEKDIEKSKGIQNEKTAKTSEYSTKKADAESKLHEVQKTESVVKDAKNELKSLMDNFKKMTKNLKELQKDPALNANLIIAQTNDLTALETKINEKQLAFKSIESDFKNNLRSSEKSYDQAKDLLKDNDGDLKSEIKNIEKSTTKIADIRKEISENEKTIESIESTEKSKKQAEIDAEIQKLNELKAAQKVFQ